MLLTDLKLISGETKTNLNLPAAGSEGDIAGSSSEGDDHHRLGKSSPFGRLQFPRDSGCYDAKSDQPDTGNNLDSVVEQCNNEILARVRRAQKNTVNLKEDHNNLSNQRNSGLKEELPYHHNSNQRSPSLKEELPYHHNSNQRGSGLKEEPAYHGNSANQRNPANLKEELSLHKGLAKEELSNQGNATVDRRPKDSYVSVRGRTTLVDPCRGGLRAGRQEHVAHVEEKLTAVKYVVGGDVEGRGWLSERSSDSGVSSSSLSSGNAAKEQRPVPGQADRRPTSATAK